MKWPFKRHRETAPVGPSPTRGLGRVGVPFTDDISDPAVLRHHAVRALSGAIMGRHSQCLSPHPFCGDISQQAVMLIADAVRQIGPGDHSVLAIYLSRATESAKRMENAPIDPLDGAISLTYLDNVPHRKLVVSPTNDGIYIASYGSILNPVERNYTTGSVDPNGVRSLVCDPEPKHAKWQYWKSGLSDAEFLPEYRCIIVHGQCWVVEADPGRGLVQQVAGLDVVDDPDHNFGIHSRRDVVYATNPTDDSEYAKVIRENCPVIGV